MPGAHATEAKIHAKSRSPEAGVKVKPVTARTQPPRARRSVHDLPILSGVSSPGERPSLLGPLYAGVRLLGISLPFDPPRPRPSLDSIHALTSRIDQEPPTLKEARKALSDLSAYATQLATTAASADESSVENHALSLLGRAYAAGSSAIACLPREERMELGAALKECLRGVFVVREIISRRDQPQPHLVQMDQMFLGSIFAPSTLQPSHRLLTSIFSLSRRFLAASNGFSKDQKPATPAVPDVVDEDARQVLDFLGLFSEEMALIDSFPPALPAVAGKVSMAATKRLDNEGRKRARRVEMEAVVLRAEVVGAMVVVHMPDIKRRAAAAPEKVDQVDQTPLPPVQSDLMQSSAHDDGAGGPAEDSVQGTTEATWEALADAALIHALTRARAASDAKALSALTDPVQPSDWLDSPPSPSAHTRARLPGSPSSIHPDDSVSNASFTSLSSASPGSTSDDDDDDDDHDDDDDDDDEGNKGPSHACPLRSLFRLHDRYEEQRLAVWLVLPRSTRPGMGTFMCGAQGKVGDAWDSLGSSLVRSFDAATLLAFGLSAEKLDNWVEMAARRNSKRTKGGH